MACGRLCLRQAGMALMAEALQVAFVEGGPAVLQSLHMVDVGGRPSAQGAERALGQSPRPGTLPALCVVDILMLSHAVPL